MRVVGLSILAIGLGLVVYGCEKREVATEPTEPAQAAEATEATESGKEAAMGLTLQWLGHASFRISHEDTVIYIDPWKLEQEPHDASLVLVSHSHGDHYSAGDIAKVRTADTELVASADVVEKEGWGEALMPGLTVELAGVRVIGVPAYNPNKRFHPRQNNWLGFVIEIAGKRIYYAGDTDLTDEMRALQNIDVALLPAGGTYTMNAEEAAEATKHLKPKLAIPYHWGEIVGKRSDAEKFVELADCEAKVLSPGDTVSLE